MEEKIVLPTAVLEKVMAVVATLPANKVFDLITLVQKSAEPFSVPAPEPTEVD